MMFYYVEQYFMMFSESHNDRQLPITSGIAITPQGSAITPQESAITPQGSALTPQKSAMMPQGLSISPLYSLLNGDWSNSVPGRQIPEGYAATQGMSSRWSNNCES